MPKKPEGVRSMTLQNFRRFKVTSAAKSPYPTGRRSQTLRKCSGPDRRPAVGRQTSTGSAEGT